MNAAAESALRAGLGETVMSSAPRVSFWIAALLAGSPAVHGQLEPRDAVEDYSRTCRFEDASIGVDYLRRSLPTPPGIQFIPGVLIFDIGVFPDRDQEITLGPGNFELSWKRADLPLVPVHSQYVIASLLRPEFSQGDRSFRVLVGQTNRRTGEFEGVTIGGPPRNPRFPGDPRQDGPPLPRAPVDPRATPPPPHADELPARVLAIHALSTDSVDHASGGYVYFVHKGKLSKLRQLLLTIRRGEEKCNLLMR